jgi:hypothetical protein
MFMRMINRSSQHLTALFDENEAELGREAGLRDTLMLIVASLALAAVLVTLTTLTALGLDALLHASFSLSSDF